jgi:hypothetical protein
MNDISIAVSKFSAIEFKELPAAIRLAVLAFPKSRFCNE